MFGMGAGELILVLVIALLVFGPKKLPELARGIGKALREFRRASSDLQEQLAVDEEFGAAVREVQSAVVGAPPPSDLGLPPSAARRDVSEAGTAPEGGAAALAGRVPEGGAAAGDGTASEDAAPAGGGTGPARTAEPGATGQGVAPAAGPVAGDTVTAGPEGQGRGGHTRAPGAA